MIAKTTELFSIEKTISSKLLSECEYPWTALDRIGEFIENWAKDRGDDYDEIDRGVFVAKDARIWQGAVIEGPAIIGHGAELRPGAFVRGNVIIGDGAVIGNSTEVKNSIILEGAQLPHYNYIGDSIIGYKAHMGAGAIASNLRLDKAIVNAVSEDEKISTGRKKVGVMLGDMAEIGCGSVLCPGTIIGRRAVVYPLSCVKGSLPEGSVFKGEKG